MTLYVTNQNGQVTVTEIARGTRPGLPAEAYTQLDNNNNNNNASLAELPAIPVNNNWQPDNE